jgi:hypothetical protein
MAGAIKGPALAIVPAQSAGFAQRPHLPVGALGGLTPRAAIERGNAERVLALTEQEGV